MAEVSIQIKQSKKDKKGDHVFICGMTGSGKSELARFLLGAFKFPRVVVIDGKHEFEPPPEWGKRGKDYGVTDDLYEVDKLFKKHGRVIWQPDVSLLEDQNNWDELDRLFDWIYETGDMVVFDDEAAMSSTSHAYPRGKRKLLKQGRSKGISVWNITQAPVGVPNDFMREATHAFVFFLGADTDRKKVAGNYGNRILKMNDPEEGFDEYMFYYYTPKRRGHLEKMNPIPLQ